jgi:hypothetical protein
MEEILDQKAVENKITKGEVIQYPKFIRQLVYVSKYMTA